MKSNQNLLTNEYSKLVSNIKQILEQGRNKAYQSINHVLTKTYWDVGRQIVEFEQGGKKRAGYGERILKTLSKELIDEFGKGFSLTNLKQMKSFYLIYSKGQKVSDLLFKLSWSHYVRLMTIKNSDERKFYEIECEKNSWSLRELNRQFDSALFERLVLSKDKEGVRELSQKGQLVEKAEDALKEPYVLEFLGLEESCKYSEGELETAIISNLEGFLLELGRGFTFVARQKRITNKSEHYFIDLVFYNRLLKCFFLIDLKIGKLTHQDLGQMQMYVNYFDREIKEDDENKTIGVVLSKENNKFVVEYTLPKDIQVYAKQYQLYLPKKEELIKQISGL
ncbi:MAG: PDDEXK nuclease domain-containing protein [bacterium]